MFVAAALLFLPFLAAALGLTALVGYLAKGLERRTWLCLLVVTSTLLITPTLGPATIAVVPVTFGWLLLPSVATWSWPELGSWVAAYPVWHAFAFPATAILSYLVLRRVRPNNSFKGMPLRGTP
jgi:hypothetical protein